MPNIVKELSLNKHPKDCKDLSLINARNIVVSNDFSCLQNELSITHHPVLTNYLEDKVLLGYIPCNEEIVLFVCSKEKYGTQDFDYAAIYCTVARYNENQEDYGVLECINNFVYHYGTITGTFTYNVHGNLIIAVAESNPAFDQMVPLRTINLGKFEQGTKGTDKGLESGLHAVSPELHVPKITDFSYIPGKTYKGWYYFFIRYKINNVDYTHWFPIGHPIFICDIEKQTIFKYGFKSDYASYLQDHSGFRYTLTGAIDYFSSKSNIADETVSINLSNFDERYEFYQIGFICAAKDSSKAFRTNDIPIDNQIFNLTINEANSYSVNELILDNYNYYNVKNVINYQNRLYISNFKEYANPQDDSVSLTNLSKIKLTYNRRQVSVNDMSYQIIQTSENNVVSSEERSVDDLIDDYDVLEQYPTYIGTSAGRTIDSVRIGEYFDYNNSLNSDVITEQGYFTTKGGNQIPVTVELWKHNGHKNIKFSIVLDSTTYACYYVSRGVISYMVVDYNDFMYDIIVGPGSTIGSNVAFINTNNSFNRRKHDKTLIPGEVYSFYIHFVNKYGEATDGYRIPNKFGLNSGIKVAVHTTSGYVEFPIAQNIYNEDGNINFNNAVAYPNTQTFRQYNTEIKALLGDLSNIPNLCWSNLPNSSNIEIINNPNNYFIPVINNNGDILYKVPFEDCSYDGTKINYAEYLLDFNLNGFNLPEGYIGYYFSYEKFEPTIKYRGLLTKFDISTQTEIPATSDNEVDYNEYNATDITKIESVNFYSSNLDIDDNLDLDFNLLYLIANVTLHTNNTVYTENAKIEFANAKFPASLNRAEYNGTPANTLIPLEKYDLIVAGDVLKNHSNIGTSIEIKNNDKLQSAFDNNKKVFKSLLFKITNNLYTNENKILIKFTDIYYNETDGTIRSGLNGCATYNDFIIYDYNRFIFNTQNNVILSEKYGQYLPTDTCNVYDTDGQGSTVLYELKYFAGAGQSPSKVAPLFYAQIFTYDQVFNEAKSFKNEPAIYYLQLELTVSDDKVTNQIKQFAENVIPLPQNTVDLFENKYTNQDTLNPKTFVNYNYNKIYLNEYNKRVRRSNVIADESDENSWRIFPLEGYKDITENKGIITNIVGIGTTFLVHTEHSLFMFDRNNTLQTADKEVQLAMPDIFDVDYKEVFTSDLGVCGLQDKFATIVDQFGYIFYDNDAHRIYRFGQGKTENIDLDIVQFINKYKPWQVRFAHDKEANRLLVNMKIYVEMFNQRILDYAQEVTLSYNYVINKWISFHDYVFDKGFNTKNMLYLLIDRLEDGSRVYTDIYVINYIMNYKINALSARNLRYNYFENLREEREVYYTANSVIDIICNPSYEHIKYLEYIAYKLYKIDFDSNIYSPTPVEELKQPYSGDTLRVFNTKFDTGLLNILVDDESYNTKKNRSIMNYKKPWWELGNWNFNYLRDKKQGNVKFPSRLYGNYFVIRFILKDDCRRIEFESLEYQITKDKP